MTGSPLWSLVGPSLLAGLLLGCSGSDANAPIPGAPGGTGAHGGQGGDGGGAGGQAGAAGWIPVPLRSAAEKAAGRSGGEAGQLAFTLAISTEDPDLLALGIDTAGVYVSEDGGHSWAIRKDGIQSNGVQSVAFDPAQSQVLWAAGLRSAADTVRAYPPDPAYVTPDADGIYRSDDLGRSWTRLRAAVFLRGQAQNAYFAFDPTSATADGSRIVYAATHDAGLLRTEDGGQSWSDVGPTGAIYNAVLRHPASGDLWLASDDGLWLSTDDAASWTALSPPASTVFGLALDPTDAGHVYLALGSTGVWETTDHGQTWQDRSNGLPTEDWRRLAVSPVDPNVLYADPQEATGPYYSHDGGQLWHRYDERQAGFFGDVHWFSQGLVPHPVEPLVAFDLGPLRTTDDGGLTWNITGNGLSGARRGDGRRSAIAFRPDDPMKMMFFHTDHGATRTEDGGDTWSHVAAPRQSDLGARTQPGGAYDPTPGSQRVVSAVGGWNSQRLCSSSNDGESWTVFDSIVDSFKFFAWHAQDTSVVYVGTASGGLRSDDGGATYNPIAEPIRAVSPANGDRLYAVVSVGQGQSRVLVSIDRGEAWASLGNEIPCTVNDVDVSPDEDARLFAACNSGIWVYEAGAWSARGESDGLMADYFGHLRFGKIAVDPRSPQVIYAGQRNWLGPGRGVFRSEDSGATWQSINWNLPRDLNVWSISVSPHDSTVWLATDHGNWRFTPDSGH